MDTGDIMFVQVRRSDSIVIRVSKRSSPQLPSTDDEFQENYPRGLSWASRKIERIDVGNYRDTGQRIASPKETTFVAKVIANIDAATNLPELKNVLKDLFSDVKVK